MNLLQGLLANCGPHGALRRAAACGVPVSACVSSRLRRLKDGLRTRHAELAATHRRNQAIVEGAGEGVLELDNVGHVRYANPAAAKLLGYDIEELLGLDYRVLINTQTTTTAHRSGAPRALHHRHHARRRRAAAA